MRFLFYSRTQDALSALEPALKNHDAHCDLIADMQRVYQPPYREHAYSGLLVDVPSRIKAPAPDKDSLARLERFYPTLLLRVLPGGELRTLSRDSMGAGIADFFDACALYSPRHIRQSSRGSLHFNLRISPSPGFEDAEQSATMNISEHGCFLISTRGWEQGDRLWLHFRELHDPSPILAEVRWNAAWGQDMRIPGFGLRFVRINEGQLEQIRHYLKDL